LSIGYNISKSIEEGAVETGSRLEEVLAAAEQCGIEVRRANLGGEGGGLCVIKGKQVLFVDTMADLETRFARTVEALATLEEIDQIYLRPEVREAIDKYR